MPEYMPAWLGDGTEVPWFPDVENALQEPPGLLAIGGQLSPEWLLTAYRHGIFPWYSPGDPLLWWSPDPRMVLFPDELHVTRSLRKRIRNGGFVVTMDHAFIDVMTACADDREDGTWISEEMVDAYTRMHHLNHAHSVEVWLDNQLVGGLYGIALGQVFFGESMFSRVNDASKVALALLVDELKSRNVRLIDCQMHTHHLASLGARLIPRREFCALVAQATRGDVLPESFQFTKVAGNFSGAPRPWRTMLKE